MIGIGVDIIEISRIKNAVKREAFLRRTFTGKEIELSGLRPETLAGFFAAKEAVSKAFGTGVVGFGLKDIEIYKDEKGKPCVTLYNNALKIAKEKEIENIMVSISHNRDNAIAFVVLLR